MRVRGTARLLLGLAAIGLATVAAAWASAPKVVTIEDFDAHG